MNDILRVEFGHEREYVVDVDRPFDEAFLQKMAEGVEILGSLTKPCRMERVRPNRFRIVLTEGRNRQIRRMCQALGYRVTGLYRVRIMHIGVAGLVAGSWQELSVDERSELLRAVGRPPA